MNNPPLQAPPPSSPSSFLNDDPQYADNFNLQFSLALQELRDIRPHLYSAAEYCESAYLYSDQKQAVLENLKDYSVKALINAVDHVGTVAFKMTELLSQRTTDISVLDIQVSCLTKRLQACCEQRNNEGLKQYQRVRGQPRRHHHYILTDHTSSEAADGKQSEKFAQPVRRKNEPRIGKSLSWHLLVDNSPTSSGSMSSSHTDRVVPANVASDKQSFKGSLPHSLSGGKSFAQNSPFTTPIKVPDQASSPRSSRSLLSLISFDESKQPQATPTPTHKKRMLSSLLSRNRSGRPKANDPLNITRH